MVDRERPKLFSRLETLLLFYERKVKVLPPYSPVADLADAKLLAERQAPGRTLQGHPLCPAALRTDGDGKILTPF